MSLLLDLGVGMSMDTSNLPTHGPRGRVHGPAMGGGPLMPSGLTSVYNSVVHQV